MIVLSILFFIQFGFIVVKLFARHRRNKNDSRYVTIDESKKKKYDVRTRINTAKFSNSTQKTSF
jgi:hypothetical protein